MPPGLPCPLCPAPLGEGQPPDCGGHRGARPSGGAGGLGWILLTRGGFTRASSPLPPIHVADADPRPRVRVGRVRGKNHEASTPPRFIGLFFGKTTGRVGRGKRGITAFPTGQNKFRLQARRAVPLLALTSSHAPAHTPGPQSVSHGTRRDTEPIPAEAAGGLGSAPLPEPPPPPLGRRRAVIPRKGQRAVGCGTPPLPRSELGSRDVPVQGLEALSRLPRSPPAVPRSPLRAHMDTNLFPNSAFSLPAIPPPSGQSHPETSALRDPRLRQGGRQWPLSLLLPFPPASLRSHFLTQK